VVLALALAATSAACSYRSEQPNPPGRRITFSGALPADLQGVLRACAGRLTLAAGQTDLQGPRDLLRLCLDEDGDFNSVLFQASPDDAAFLRWSALAGVISGIDDEEFGQPLPESLGSFDVVREDLALLAWVIPLLDAQLQDQNIPAPVRQGILATFVPILSQPTCRLTATVDVEFHRVGLEDHVLRWANTTAGQPHLRFSSTLDADRAVAIYAITPRYECLGSTANPLHAVLQLLFSCRINRVFIADGDVRLNILLGRDGSRITGTPQTIVTLRDLAIGKPFPWVPDDVWNDMLVEFDVTPARVEADVEPRVTTALAGLGDNVAAILTEQLELRYRERPTQVSVDAANPRNLQVVTGYPGCTVLPNGILFCPPTFPPLP
jgi:hypothetical protein